MFWSFLICWVESTRLIATGCEVRPKIPQISCSISRWRWTLMMVQSWWLRIRRWKTFSCCSVSVGNSNQFYYSMWPSECIWVWPRAPNLDGFHIFLLFSCCDLKTDQDFDSYPHGFVWKWILSINPYKSNGLPTTNAHFPFEPQLFFPICFSFFSLFSWPKRMDGTRVSPSLLDQGQAWRLWRLRRRAEFGLKLGLHHVEHGRTHPNPLVSFHLIISHEIPSWMIHWLTVFQIILGVPLTTGTWEPWQDDLCDPRYWTFQEVALQSDGFSMAQLKWVNSLFFDMDHQISPVPNFHTCIWCAHVCTREILTSTIPGIQNIQTAQLQISADGIVRSMVLRPNSRCSSKLLVAADESCGICDSVYWIQQGPLSFVDAGCFIMFYDWIYNVVCL